MMTNMTTTSSTISNSTDKLPDFIHKFSVEDHNYWKPKLLDSIELMKKRCNSKLNKEGYYYDFHDPQPRTYKELVDNILFEFNNIICEKYGLATFGTEKPRHIEQKIQYWYQQYFKDSSFGWHTHSGHWAFVYYVELENSFDSTDFLNYGTFDVSEGDIIYFPTFLVHRSPIITSDTRKTIIAGNLNFTVDRKLIERYGEEHFRNR